jgi:hypothetical protein
VKVFGYLFRLALAYLCLVVVWFLTHWLTLAIVCSVAHWDYDRVADACNAVVYWPLAFLWRQQWLLDALEIVGGLWILWGFALLAFALPWQLFRWLFRLCCRGAHLKVKVLGELLQDDEILGVEGTYLRAVGDPGHDLVVQAPGVPPDRAEALPYDAAHDDEEHRHDRDGELEARADSKRHGGSLRKVALLMVVCVTAGDFLSHQPNS